MPAVGFEPAVSKGERPQTYALDRSATGKRTNYKVSQPPSHGPVPGPGVNYTGPREFLLQFVILVF